jgi:tripartite-type tricarboxylate transporter receptor subunit TctC
MLASPPFPTRALLAGAALLAAGAATAPARAQTGGEFYKGKEIKFIIGQPVGGGYDTYARFFARHLGHFLPGEPSVIVQNMPGAAGVVMTNSLVAQQPRDGTVVGAAAGSISTAALFGASGARYDARELGWIGSLNSEVGLVVSYKTAPVKKLDDMYVTEFITGGSGATDGNVIFPRTMNQVLGMKFKVIPGYGGTTQVSLAMERGEIHGTGSWHYSSIMASKPQWLTDGSINVLVQLALKRHPKVPNVPTVIELAKTDEQRAILELVFAQQDMGRPVFAPPGLPPERLAALRAAFDAFVKDPKVQAEADQMKIELNNPMPGAEIDKLIARLHAMPKDAIQKAADAIKAGS